MLPPSEIARLEARAAELRTNLWRLGQVKAPAWKQTKERMRLASKLAHVENKLWADRQGRLFPRG